MRFFINRGAGNTLEVSTTDGHVYCFDIKKRPGKPTRLHGIEYNRSIADYDMRNGDKIKFNMKMSPI